jgi:hypothetical protein
MTNEKWMKIKTVYFNNKISNLTSNHFSESAKTINVPKIYKVQATVTTEIEVGNLILCL